MTEQQIQLWASAPTRENSRSASTYEQIKDILKNKFGNSVDIYLQGSYANSTNIKQDSDVDIVICYSDSYFFDINSLDDNQQKLFHTSTSSATYKFETFKDEVHDCLQKVFGSSTERIDKCIRVTGNHQRVDADIVACFKHKRFENHSKVSAEGIQFTTDKGEQVISFPKQHLENGETKNIRTNTKYKAVVRILKNCKKNLVDNHLMKEKLISSFFIECLVWNTLDSTFSQYGSIATANAVLAKIYQDMKDEKLAKNYAEVSDLFYLFPRSKITRDDVILFTEKAYELINS